MLIKQKISYLHALWTQTILVVKSIKWHDFAINAIAILFVHERLNIPEAYSETSWASKMELFAKIVNNKASFDIFAESSILDVRLGSEYIFTFLQELFHILLGKILGKEDS